MARKVFFSFHYDRDAWRVQQVEQMGALEGQPLLTANEWEKVQKKGDAAIKQWIADKMTSKSCVVVLIGKETAGRKWVRYEIEKGWNDGKGVVGVYIHNLKDEDGNQDSKGSNPFSTFKIGDKKMSEVVKAYDPPFTSSTSFYQHIAVNIEDWVEEAIEIRKKA